MAKGTSGSNKGVAVIGAGHMGSALIAGLLKNGARKEDILIGTRSSSNKKAVRGAGIVFLAVKPGIVGEVLRDIRAELQGKVVVSVAAGVTLSYLKRHAGTGVSVARIMPNLPSALGEGVVGFMRGNLNAKEARAVSKLLSRLGTLVSVKTDREIDSLTLIAGCGPGVVASLVEALGREAKRYGLKGSRADAVAFQTFKGTLSYMQANRISAANLKAAVATKGGVTEAILMDLEKRFKRDLAHALTVGAKRIRKIRR